MVLDCIVVGDVMMDLILKSDQRIVNSLSINGTNYFSSSRVVPGGSGNVAAALSHLGAKVALVGRAGGDIYGRAYVEDLESRGILSGVEFDDSASTGFTVALVEPGGHRTMLVSRGANDNLTPEQVGNHLGQLGPAKFVYLSGYSLLNMPQREAILQAARIGKENNSHVVFDPGSSNLISNLADIFGQVIASSDVVCANLAESTVLAEGLDPSEYAKLLSRKGKRVIIKMGPDGCLVSDLGNLQRIRGVPAVSLDTTGAGDAFLSGLLFCLSKDFDIGQSASFANWFAARKVEGLGPRHFASKGDAVARLNALRKESLKEESQI